MKWRWGSPKIEMPHCAERKEKPLRSLGSAGVSRHRQNSHGQGTVGISPAAGDGQLAFCEISEWPAVPPRLARLAWFVRSGGDTDDNVRGKVPASLGRPNKPLTVE